MINIITWLLFPVWLDIERITRKSQGIKGYIQSVVFYHDCFVNACKMYGGICKTVKIYTIKVY